MTGKKIITLFFFFILINVTGFGQIISSIDFVGLKRTKLNHVLRFIDSKTGADLDSVTLAKDLQELRNLKLFEEIESFLYYGDSTVQIIFSVREVYALLPNFDMGVTNNILRLQSGFNDYNTFGRGGMTNLYIKYYERFSYIVSGDYQYFFNNHYGLAFDISKNSTIEPVYIRNEEKKIYNYDVWKALLYLRYDVNRKNFFKIGGGYVMDDYWRRDTTMTAENINENFAIEKILIRASNTYNKLNYNFEYIEGFYNDISVESNHLINYNQDHYWKILNESKFFFKPYSTANIALRLRLGYATKQPGPLMPFVQDDYVNLRGSGNRRTRGYSEITLSAEHRQTVYRNRFGAFGVVAFTDIGNLGEENYKTNSVFDPNYAEVFLGGGIRLFVSRLHGLVVRVDYAMNMNKYSQRGLVGGVHHYF
jgi:outer membrane protein assembly factor BamA